MSRAAWLNCQHERSRALVLTLFLFQKGQGFFPPLPIAALLPCGRRGAYAALAGILLPSQRMAVSLTPCGGFRNAIDQRVWGREP